MFNFCNDEFSWYVFLDFYNFNLFWEEFVGFNEEFNGFFCCVGFVFVSFVLCVKRSICGNEGWIDF